MAKWGTHSYECDEIMDRVGDVWDGIFNALTGDRAFRAIEASFKEVNSGELGLLLWRYCGIELPKEFIMRLVCLLTADRGIAQAVVSKLESYEITTSIRKVVEQSAEPRRTLGGVVSFFVRELRAPIEFQLKSNAIQYIEHKLSSVHTEQERTALFDEILSLRAG